MEYELSDLPGERDRPGEYEARSAVSCYGEPGARRDRALHIPEQEDDRSAAL